MRFDTGQYTRMSQQQKLAPRMIQSMEILQLSSQALEERIEQELASNPTLELADPTDRNDDEVRAEAEQDRRDDGEGERELKVQNDADDPNHSADFERLSNMSDEYGDSWENTYEGGESYRPAARNTGERDVKLDAMSNTAARPQSLAEQLLDQWHLVETSEAIRDAGEFLIGFIDNDGYIRSDMPTLLKQAPMGMTHEHLEDGIEMIQQTMEPVGIGARDVGECFSLQIDAAAAQLTEKNGDAEALSRLMLAARLVRDHLKDIEMNRLPKIAKALDITVDDVKQGIGQLRHFRAHPGRMLVSDNPRRIRPDAIIEYDEIEDRYIAMLANDRLPSLQISQRYETMAKDKAVEKKTRDFVGNNLRSASWLVDAIRQRHSTLLRVINVVIDAQREFLDQGEQYLRPLPMTQVADQLGIHVATVSRAVNEKYIQTPRGIFPLRMFFSGGTETEGGESMSWSAVQAKLKDIIDEEDKNKPFNDDQLVEKLKEKGIEIARRTVAKYRGQMNIPPARQRREY